MDKILIFIPCFQCEKQIERVIYKLSHSEVKGTILMIDNQSQDQTLAKAIEAASKLTLRHVVVIQNKQNYNLGGSHKVAFTYALENDYSHVIVLHGDDQANPNDLMAYFKNGLYRNYDCLLGSRFHPESQLLGYSQFRTFGNKMLNLFCRLVCKADITDMGSGLNLYSRRFLADTRYMNFPDDLTFNISLLFHAYMNNFRVAFFPMTWKEEDQISNAKVMKQMMSIMKRIMLVLDKPSELYQGEIKKYPFEVMYQN